MANRPKKIPELNSIASFSANDLFIVEQIGASNTTSKIAGRDVIKSMVKGPYADDSSAAAAGVEIGQMYYTDVGTVYVRLA